MFCSLCQKTPTQPSLWSTLTKPNQTPIIPNTNNLKVSRSWGRGSRYGGVVAVGVRHVKPVADGPVGPGYYPSQPLQREGASSGGRGECVHACSRACVLACKLAFEFFLSRASGGWFGVARIGGEEATDFGVSCPAPPRFCPAFAPLSAGEDGTHIFPT